MHAFCKAIYPPPPLEEPGLPRGDGRGDEVLRFAADEENENN